MGISDLEQNWSDRNIEREVEVGEWERKRAQSWGSEALWVSGSCAETCQFSPCRHWTGPHCSGSWTNFLYPSNSVPQEAEVTGCLRYIPLAPWERHTDGYTAKWIAQDPIVSKQMAPIGSARTSWDEHNCIKRSAVPGVMFLPLWGNLTCRTGLVVVWSHQTLGSLRPLSESSSFPSEDVTDSRSLFTLDLSHNPSRAAPP